MEIFVDSRILIGRQLGAEKLSNLSGQIIK